ncbi:MBL fold metallo-hydrolase [Pedobacter sp. AW1-32]|uniref:MBL fold metallo-hydrolase n=1 Tax=Pedobacter sp. AW1-32 TaxID=3383026 RepID=UPI003FEF1AAB
MKVLFFSIILCLYLISPQQTVAQITEPKQNTTSAFVLVLGVAQDGGFPHMGCEKICCTKAWENVSARRNVVSLALVDPKTKKWWLFEATPDIKQQLKNFRQETHGLYAYLPEGIFITHAHIGHYTGLMQFGREVMATKELKVYALPKLCKFLSTNGPWSQLVDLKNINLQEINTTKSVKLGLNRVEVFTVPHRDEFSETAGFKITTPGKKYLFIPDVDKWSKWNRDIISMVKNVDIAFLDATFYQNGELGNRPMEEIPHPFVEETTALFAKEPKELKAKIHFIHFNHTNPLMWDPDKQKELLKEAFNFAKELSIY